MEFPVCSPLPDYDESSPTVRYMTDWCTLENGVFITALSTIIGFSHGFYITVYEESRNTLTVEVDPEAGLYTVRRANGELTGQPIYYIKCFAQDKGTDVVAEGYTILFYSNGYILAAKLATEIYNGKPLTVSDIADTVHPLTF